MINKSSSSKNARPNTTTARIAIVEPREQLHQPFKPETSQARYAFGVPVSFAQSFLQQLERETTSTRRLLEQVPDGRSEWKPHPKSMPLGYLSFLVAVMPSWIASILERDFLDLAQGGAAQQRGSGRELVKIFDDSVAAARRALENASDEVFLKTWQLRVDGRVVDEKTRHATITETFSHLAHHRGQLTVYLRLNDRPLPSIYGPTADEKWS